MRALLRWCQRIKLAMRSSRQQRNQLCAARTGCLSVSNIFTVRWWSVIANFGRAHVKRSLVQSISPQVGIDARSKMHSALASRWKYWWIWGRKLPAGKSTEFVCAHNMPYWGEKLKISTGWIRQLICQNWRLYHACVCLFVYYGTFQQISSAGHFMNSRAPPLWCNNHALCGVGGGAIFVSCFHCPAKLWQ
jgi:hypothetical protein